MRRRHSARPGFSGPFFCLIASGSFSVQADDHRMSLIKCILRLALRALALTALRVSWHVRPESVDALRAGRCIVVCNHSSFLDGVLLALICPVPLTFTSEREQSVENAFTATGMRVLVWLGFGAVIPLDSGSPMAIRSTLRCLHQNGNVMIFPDGRITGSQEIAAPKPGVDWLVSRSGCQVIQARIRGAENHRFFGKRGREWFPAISVVI